MYNFELNTEKKLLKLLFIGAHSDDIEIGCGGTLLKWIKKYNEVKIAWVILCANGERSIEAEKSAMEITNGVKKIDLYINSFTDGFLPSQLRKVKEFFEKIKHKENPDIIFTHRLEDRHQDHKLISELTWQTFRNHMIIEYEIPKFEGDLGQPNLFVIISKEEAYNKIEHLNRNFKTQNSKNWYRSELFYGLMQVRGIECRSESGYAEGFYSRKLII